jgi:CO/xanthine dehydrogenase Mo-binding subunit
MDLKKLLGLRPKTDTVEAISNAIAMAEAERAAALTRITELENGRGNLILTGDVQAMEAGERALSSARAEAEQLGVMAAALKPQLEAAKVREKAAEITEAAKVAKEQVEQFLTWWRERYPTLANQMRDGFLLETAALKKIGELHKMQLDHPAAFAASGATIPQEPTYHVYPGDPSNVVGSVAGGARLPPPVGKARPHGDAAPFWPLHELY